MNQTPIRFILNDTDIQTHLPPGATVLDFVREHRRLTGTKIGCREGDCGACTVLVGEWREDQMNYRTMTSCLMPLGNASGKHIVTIEGLNLKGLTPVQQAIVDEGATQCGFCTVGFVVSLTSACLALNGEGGTVLSAMDGNICRCTGYKSLERAAFKIESALSQRDTKNPISWLVDHGFLPAYFRQIAQRITALTAAITRETAPPEPGGQRLAGGTDLLVQKPEEIAKAPVQLVADLQELRGIGTEDGFCRIGAAATAEDLKQSPIMRSMFPGMDGFMKLVSSTPIRNMGTVAGNFVNASPIGDLTIFFLALDTELTLQGTQGTRTLPLKSFYKGYKSLAKSDDEQVTSLRFKLPEKGSFFNFEKVSKRTHLDIASVNSAASLNVMDGTIKSAAISAGGVAPIPLFLQKTSDFLIGKTPDEQTFTRAAAIALNEIKPIGDARGSVAYKRLLCRQLIYAHFMAFFPDRLSLEALV